MDKIYNYDQYLGMSLDFSVIVNSKRLSSSIVPTKIEESPSREFSKWAVVVFPFVPVIPKNVLFLKLGFMFFKISSKTFS